MNEFLVIQILQMQTYHLIQVFCLNIAVQRAKDSPKERAGKNCYMRLTHVLVWHVILKLWKS